MLTYPPEYCRTPPQYSKKPETVNRVLYKQVRICHSGTPQESP